MFDKIAQTISQVLPGEVGEELKKNIDAMVKAKFEQMNLVTRDQMEIQEKILRRTRDRITQLEQQIEALEKKLENK